MPDRFGDKIELYEFILGAFLGVIVTYSWHSYWYPIIGLIYIGTYHLHHLIVGGALMLLVIWNPTFLHKLPHWLDGFLLGFAFVVVADDWQDWSAVLRGV